MDEPGMAVTVTRVIADMGTVVIMEGVMEGSGETVTFVADHRMAQIIVSAMEGDVQAVADVPPWAMLGGSN